MKDNIEAILDDLIERYPRLKSQRGSVRGAYEILKTSFENGGKLLVGGNGGSAADSNHIAGELMKEFLKKRPVSGEFRARLMEIAAGFEAASKDSRKDLENAAHLADTLQRSLPTIAVTEHSALNTAYLNDSSSVDSFAQQVMAYGRAGDVFLGITTSGNSSNVLNACLVAGALGMKTIGLTGRDGGLIRSRVDLAIIVPETEVYKIQELHLPVYHALCQMLEEYFF